MQLKPSEDAMRAMFERQDDMRDQMVRDFRSGRYDAMPWRVASADKLIRLWTDAAAEGFIRHEKRLEALERIIVDNVLKLAVTTEISGHTAVIPEEALEEHFSDPEEMERFISWAVDLPDGGFRVSDYGMNRLFELAALATETEDPMQRLAVLDMILNVTHQRSDLASWFVEGGAQTLSRLADDQRPGLCRTNDASVASLSPF